jgi:hypothetical protein
MLLVGVIVVALGGYILSQRHINSAVTATQTETQAIQRETLALKGTTQDLKTLVEEVQVESDAIHEVIVNGKSAASINAKKAAKEALIADKALATLEADHVNSISLIKTIATLGSSLLKQENLIVELVAVEQEELAAAFPGKTIKVTCTLDAATHNQLECKIVKTPKKT